MTAAGKGVRSVSEPEMPPTNDSLPGEGCGGEHWPIWRLQGGVLSYKVR